MKIALLAHDNKVKEMIEFVKKYKQKLENYDLISIGKVGKAISDVTGLKIKRYLGGPYGGDQQIGSRIAEGKIDLVVFFRDTLTVQPHEQDVTALLRVCDVHNVAVVTNTTSAELIIKAF